MTKEEFVEEVTKSAARVSDDTGQPFEVCFAVINAVHIHALASELGALRAEVAELRRGRVGEVQS